MFDYLPTFCVNQPSRMDNIGINWLQNDEDLELKSMLQKSLWSKVKRRYQIRVWDRSRVDNVPEINLKKINNEENKTKCTVSSTPTMDPDSSATKNHQASKELKKKRNVRVSLESHTEKKFKVKQIYNANMTMQDNEVSSSVTSVSLPNEQPQEPIASSTEDNISEPSSEDLEDYLRLVEDDEDTPGTKIGFIGCGNLGFLIVKRLLNEGFQVYIWNRTLEKCRELVYAGARIRYCPADVISASDITFCCVSNAEAVKEVVYGRYGVIRSMQPGKLFVDLSGIDKETSMTVADSIFTLGGRYLEVRLNGSYTDAEHGRLIIFACGGEEDYINCIPCFRSFGYKIQYLGQRLGQAIHMNMIIDTMYGITISGIAEGLALAKSLDFKEADVLNILEKSPLCCPFVMRKTLKHLAGDLFPEVTSNHLAAQLKIAVDTGNQVLQPLLMTATTLEYFKLVKRNGLGTSDISAVFSVVE